jgi:hypothetical protein
VEEKKAVTTAFVKQQKILMAGADEKDGISHCSRWIDCIGCLLRNKSGSEFDSARAHFGC